MKILTAALLSTALITSPALACGFGKTAETKRDVTAALVGEEVKIDEAMSTYDPAEKPAFEAEKAEDGAKEVKEAVE